MSGLRKGPLRSSATANLLGAIASGLFLGYMMAWIRNSDGMYVYDTAKTLLLAVGSYLLAALLLSINTERQRYRIPQWISIAALGTVLSHLAIITIPNEIDNWVFRTEPSIAKYVLERSQKSALYLFGFSVINGTIALLIMGTIHYAKIALRQLRR